MKSAEEKAYNELVSEFRSINTKITALNKEKYEIEKEYKKWWKECKKFVGEFSSSKTISEKAETFYDKSVNNLSEGRNWVKKLQEANAQMKEQIIELINGITLTEGPSP